MDAPREPDRPDAPERRATVRRTVWTLAIVAGMIYGYFIVKTFLQQAASP